MTRVIVVDDQPEAAVGRTSILEQAGVPVVATLNFEEALAYGQRWRDVDVVVLDGHDRRDQARRIQAASDAGVQPLREADRYPGPTIASAIRAHSPPERTRIILISAYARENPEIYMRAMQTGVNHIFESKEIGYDSRQLVRAVLDPDSFSPPRDTFDWGALGYDARPDVAGAVTAVFEADASELILERVPPSLLKGQEHRVRTLRARLSRMTRMKIMPGNATIRSKQAVRRDDLRAFFDRALGRQLPRD